jgi:hypothetical protein
LPPQPVEPSRSSIEKSAHLAARENV